MELVPSHCFLVLCVLVFAQCFNRSHHWQTHPLQFASSGSTDHANASQLCVGYTESKFFPRHACSGPAILHSLKAAVFSVCPTTPLQLFTIILFCSWAWSIGIAERWFVFLETTQWPWSWNSLTIDRGRYSQSWMWTGSQWAEWVWSNAKPCDYWL